MNDLPKNLPDDIGREKNIVSKSEISGLRGDVSSKIGIGSDVHFESSGRRRPHINTLYKFLAVCFGVSLLIIGILFVVSWRLAEIREEGRAEVFVEDFLKDTDLDEWKEHLVINLPDTYSAYENASKLAEEILAPVLKIGQITYLRSVFPSPEGYLVYDLFSEGKLFASIVMMDPSVGMFSGGAWEINRIEFNMAYFSGIEFPEYRITVPAGATLSINGKEIDPALKEELGDVYPALSEVEKNKVIAPCDTYIFNDIYFEPKIEASLSGESLERGDIGKSEYFFYYPESARHSIKVTVPVGVDAYVSDLLLTEEWAAREEIDGVLGDLDDGGTGTFPRLSVWTVADLFGEVTVQAKIGEKDVQLLSSENGNYIFDTPDECKYTVTVILPVGAELFVNGKPIDASLKSEGGATAEDIAYGFTALGRYDVSELGVVEGATPNFDKYVLTGYLAQPSVTAKLGGAELECSGIGVEGYTMRCDFDFSPGASFDSARINAAQQFAEKYIAYICGGGAWLDPSNEAAFKANYDAIRNLMTEGTAGYIAVMESYRDVNLMPKYDSFKINSNKAEELVTYSEKSLSCKVEFTVTRTRMVDGAPVTETLTGSISVLQVLYNGEWRVWSFLYEA